jgi:hypothetical protein
MGLDVLRDVRGLWTIGKDNMIQTWKCVNCDETFRVGDWLCVDKLTNHVVERKEYLLADAPSDPGHASSGGMDSLRDGRTIICNIPPPQKVMEGDEVKWVGEGHVEFVRGRYSTTDPQQQYWLDRKGGFCSQERWEQVWLSQSQQLQLKEMSLKAREQRLENDRNELLTQVQKQKKEPVAAR